MAVVHSDLLNYYKIAELLHANHNYSLQDIDEMYPFERDIYIDLIGQRQQEQQ